MFLAELPNCDCFRHQVDGKSTPASVDLKLANHPTTAAMNSSIASTNNATLATVAATYALKSVVDQLAIDVAARQTAADVDQRVATALLSYLTQTAYQAGQALQDTRLDGHDAGILALQNTGPFATAGDLSNLQLTLQSAIDGILAEIATLGGATNLVNAPAWLGNVTWDLLAGTNQIRNLHATGPLSIQLATNDDWTLSFGCDAYSKAEADALLAPLASEVWVSNEILAALAAYSTTVQVGTAISDALGAYSSTAEMNTAISDAIDALNVGQYQDAGGVQFLIDQALLAYWTQAEVSSFVAGELANYATSSSVTSAISSALSSYDNSSQVDSKIITALLDFYTQTEVDQQITNALGNVDLSNYFTQAETQSYVASELLAFYPRTELDSQLTATFTQYWTSGRTQTEIDDAIAGAGFLTQAQADTRYFAVSANASFESLVRTNVTPPMIKALLPRAPLAANTILTDTTLELTCDAFEAESDGRYLSSSSFAPLDARYFARNPAVAEGNGLFHLVQDQFTPQFIRSLLFRPPLTGGAILGNGSVIEIEADCWSKAQSDGRYPLGGHLQLPRQHGHVHRPPGHRPGERPWRGPHGGPHRQLAHGHELRPDAPAAERRGGPADQERHHDPSRRRRHAGGQLRRRQHRAGARHHRPVGPDAQRHHGGLRPVLRGLHGGHRGLHEHGRVHEGGGHQGPARQAGGDRHGSGGGDHPGTGAGRGQLRRYHRLGQRVSRARRSAAGGRGAPPEGPDGPQRNGGRR